MTSLNMLLQPKLAGHCRMPRMSVQDRYRKPRRHPNHGDNQPKTDCRPYR